MYDWHLYVILLVFMGLDVVSGLLRAAKDHDIESTKMREGLIHKLGYVLAVALCVACDWAGQSIDLGLPFDITTACIVVLSLTEILSIVENLGGIFPPLGKILERLFGEIKSKEGERKDDEG